MCGGPMGGRGMRWPREVDNDLEDGIDIGGEGSVSSEV